MNQLVAEYLANPLFSLTATERLILVALSDQATGMRIEDIARVTGSKFRWVARQVSRLLSLGILHRVSPGTYALCGVVKQPYLGG